jgi:hypothetical protein
MAGLRCRVDRLAQGNDHEQVPEVGAVGQLGEQALFGPAAEAGKGADGDVLFVRRRARRILEPFARQTDQAAEIPRPEFIGGRGIAGLDLGYPEGNRSTRRHR